jgi:protein TonB
MRQHPLTTSAALLLNQSLLITAPASRLRAGWLGASIGLHLLAGAGLFLTPMFQFDSLERPSLDRKEVVGFLRAAAPPLRGNGQHHDAVQNNVKPPPVTDKGLKLPQLVQNKPETATQPIEAITKNPLDNPGPGDDPDGVDNGVRGGKGDKNSTSTNPEGRDLVDSNGPPGIVRAYDLTDPPVLVSHEEPVYPETARSQGIEGIVILELVVDENGRVMDARIMRSDNSLFNTSALAAVKRWKYTAARADGRAVRTYKTATIRFTLHG